MAHTVRQGRSREAGASAREFGRLPYSRFSFELVAHLVGAFAVADHQDIEYALIDAVEVPEEARSISVVAGPGQCADGGTAAAPGGRPKKGAPKKPVERNFRLACCGTVTLNDEDWVGRHTIRYSNLLSNAVKFTPSGVVRLAVQVSRPGWIRFDVSDTVIG